MIRGVVTEGLDDDITHDVEATVQMAAATVAAVPVLHDPCHGTGGIDCFVMGTLRVTQCWDLLICAVIASGTGLINAPSLLRAGCGLRSMIRGVVTEGLDDDVGYYVEVVVEVASASVVAIPVLRVPCRGACGIDRFVMGALFVSESVDEDDIQDVEAVIQIAAATIAAIPVLHVSCRGACGIGSFVMGALDVSQSREDLLFRNDHTAFGTMLARGVSRFRTGGIDGLVDDDVICIGHSELVTIGSMEMTSFPTVCILADLVTCRITECTSVECSVSDR